MKKIILYAILSILVISCGSVLISGRKQLLLVPDDQVLASSLTQYNNYISNSKRIINTPQYYLVVKVGKRLAMATETYLKQNGYEDELKNFQWEFNLVDNPQLNAFCMPGGKIVVYSGLLNIINKEDELAVVLGHEIAHAVAKHSNERMSQQLLAQLGGNILNYSLHNKDAKTQMIANQVYGLGAQYGVMLPFSRKHELEADYLGLIFMYLAGYNPNYAISFWSRMQANSGNKPMEILSTHPSDEHRIQDIKKNIPQIIAKYKPI